MLLPVRSPEVEVAMIAWEDGGLRLESLDLAPRQERVIRHVVDEIAAELARRMGQTFTLAQLARVYRDSAPWCRDIAQQATEQVWAHDLTIVQDAAFDRFARIAVDYRP